MAGLSLIELAIAFVTEDPAVTSAIIGRGRWSSSTANFPPPIGRDRTERCCRRECEVRLARLKFGLSPDISQ
jgi:hypothetical protein